MSFSFFMNWTHCLWYFTVCFFMLVSASFYWFPMFFQLSASLTLKKSLFGSTPKKHVEAPFLYQWLGKLQDALVSKVIFIQFYVRYLFVRISYCIWHNAGANMSKEIQVIDWVKEPISACLYLANHNAQYNLRRVYVKVMKSRKGDRYGKKVWINLPVIHAVATCMQCLPIFWHQC